MNEERWDVVVVGGGAGGLSAALTLARSRRRVLVVDAGEPRNAPADGVHNYLGREGSAPGELTAIGRAEVENYGGVVRTGRVVSASPSHEGGFLLGLDDGGSARARRVVLATGVVDELPGVTGLRERWGRDVIHCPYCHGWEVRDRRVGVLATSPMAMHHVGLMRQLTDDLVLFLNDAYAPERHAADELDARGVEVVTGAVSSLEVVDDALRGVRLADGTVVTLDALLVPTVVRARAEVATMLGLSTTEQRMGGTLFGEILEVDARGETAVSGVWAVGNATDVSATVIASAAAGTKTGAMVNADLVAEDGRLALMAHRDGSPAFWERFYADRDQVWSGRPNPVLAATAEDLAPGTALDLGAGEGGDALWLAGRGWKVTAVDVAQTACDRIVERAGDLPVRTERHDLTESFPEDSYDLVSAQYLHSPNADFPRTAILRRAAEAVAPGGTLLVVGHGRLAPWSWDPSLRMATAPEVLASLALDDAAWEVVRCESPERTATGPDGQEATITDEVLRLRRM
ncbi:NAD(P)/FAD-dependent oxidoreductase [Actinomycetospora endophytica]|uniref:NAD(P)/FAD-dependent oxidoreductase n=1 Tax=Actinomycetospora endophytica TaxID=2291215 RepID=A0ABS8PHM5_9PSEU|nr:bifunctional NAD(P)/FAD-dependent oxidoreductase/class I SAM-dependent methyltransferase [Actinomycetospora endophytica]MCD2197759.1 NAD(P)/FAD-dependent oxidoreductase [Actinomycetospora endophytica]